MKTWKHCQVIAIAAIIALALAFTACNKGGGGGGGGTDGTRSTGGTGGDVDSDWKWTAVSNSPFGSTDAITAIAYGNNRFIAGGGGKMAYSSDGASWTAVADSTFGTSRIRAIAYGGGRWVAGGGDRGKMVYSDDNGVTWTAVADSTFGTSDIKAIAYGNNRFVAVGDDGKMAYSANGASWTAVADSKFPATYTSSGYELSYVIQAIAYGNNRFVAVGDHRKMAYSTDGASWTAVEVSEITVNNDIIAYGNNRFVVTVDNLGDVAYSDNGASWTAVKVQGQGGMYIILSIAYGKNRFVAGDSSGRIAYADW
jgi:hypothetical protein